MAEGERRIDNDLPVPGCSYDSLGITEDGRTLLAVVFAAFAKLPAMTARYGAIAACRLLPAAADSPKAEALRRQALFAGLILQQITRPGT